MSKQLNLRREKISREEVISAFDEKQEITFKAYANLRIFGMPNKIFKIEFLELPILQESIILGLDFMTSHKVTINFTENVIKIHNSELEIRKGKERVKKILLLKKEDEKSNLYLKK